MTKSSLSPAEVALRSERRAILAEERARQARQRVIDEDERITSNAAKTARLRGLREARDAAEREVEEASAATRTSGGKKPGVARRARRPA
jgi:small-conductance mechanosensitive channel